MQRPYLIGVGRAALGQMNDTPVFVGRIDLVAVAGHLPRFAAGADLRAAEGALLGADLLAGLAVAFAAGLVMGFFIFASPMGWRVTRRDRRGCC